MFPHVPPLSHSWVTVLCAGPSKWVMGMGGGEGGCGELSEAVIFTSDTEKTRQRETLEPSLPATRCQKQTGCSPAEAAHAVARPPSSPCSRPQLGRQGTSSVKSDCGSHTPRPAGLGAMRLPVSTQHLSWGSVRESVTFLKEANLHLDLPL